MHGEYSNDGTGCQIARWCLHAENDLKKHVRHRDLHGKQVENMIRLLGNYQGPRVRHYLGKSRGTIASSKTLVQFHSPEAASVLSFLERLNLPFASDEILSSYEDIVSSGTDKFTSWVKTDPDTYLSTTYGRFKKPLLNFAENQKGDTLHLLKRTAPTMCLIVLLCKNDSGSTTGIQDPGVGRKMLLGSKLKASGTSSQFKKQLSMWIIICAIPNKDTFHPKYIRQVRLP